MGTKTWGGDVLSRVLIEGVSFKIVPPAQAPIELSAEEAKMGADFAVIQLEGGVVLKNQRCHIEAPLALWSTPYDGLLFPSGYTRRHRRYYDSAFFAVGRDGKCRRVMPAPPVAYVDELEAQEARFLANLSRKMPAYVRFMLGAGLGH